MDRLILEVRAALNAHAFLLALQGSLALIDICAALSADDGRTRGSRFRAWFEENLASKYDLLSAEDVYQLRCGMIHQGRTASDQYDRILFGLPTEHGNIFHNAQVNNDMLLYLPWFCEDIMRAAEAWWEDAQSTDPVKTNAEDMARYRPDGYGDSILGLAILA